MDMLVATGFMMVMSCIRSSNSLVLHRHQMHAALGTVSGMILADIRVHGTGV
jgi:hypothetical protein